MMGMDIDMGVTKEQDSWLRRGLARERQTRRGKKGMRRNVQGWCKATNRIHLSFGRGGGGFAWESCGFCARSCDGQG